MTEQQDDARQDADDAQAVLTTGANESAGRSPDGRSAAEGGGFVGAGVKDDLEGGATGATSMTGGDWSDASSGQPGPGNDASPGGRTSPAGEALGPIGMESANGGPNSDSIRADANGPAAEGSFGSGTYNERGNVTGPDSPAGSDAALYSAEGEAQGDDLANRLGGGDNTRTGLTGAGAATGDMRADRSETSGASAPTAAGAGGPSAGDVGGMGGVRGHTAGSLRPPGGQSPLQNDPNHEG